MLSSCQILESAVELEQNDEAEAAPAFARINHHRNASVDQRREHLKRHQFNEYRSQGAFQPIFLYRFRSYFAESDEEDA